MSEELEALEKLEQDIKDRVIFAEDRQLKLCATIKQALLELQTIKEAEPSEAVENLKYLKNLTKVKDVSNVFYWNQSYEKVEQALLKAEKLEKAWEVVKEKNVDVATFNDYQTVIEYNWSIRFEKYKRKELTEEEFDLLKEMLE